MAIKESIQIRGARETDRFNDPIGEVPAWRTIPGVTVVPRASDEDDRRGPVIIAGFMLAFPGKVFDTAGRQVFLTERDEYKIRGEVHQVDGDVGDYRKKIIVYTIRAK